MFPSSAILLLFAVPATPLVSEITGLAGSLISSITSDLIQLINGVCPITVPGSNPNPSDLKCYIFSRENPDQGNPYDNSVTLDNRLTLKIILHGWISSANSKWVLDMKDSYLENENVTVLLCDWSNRSKKPYSQAAASTVAIGAYLAQLMMNINEEQGLPFVDMHCIGHSLGAHICGFASRLLPNNRIGRISGLDPAGPCFDCPTVKGLGLTDAAFVDVVHTDMGQFGTKYARGHFDAYPNGGVAVQPGCINLSSIRSLLGSFTCSHSRSHDYFNVSISQTYFCDNQPYYKFGEQASSSRGRCDLKIRV